MSKLRISNQVMEPGVLWVYDIEQDVDWTMPFQRLWWQFLGFNEYRKKMVKWYLENRVDVIIDTETKVVFIPKVEQVDRVAEFMNRVLLDDEQKREDNPIDYVTAVKDVAHGMMVDDVEFQELLMK